MQWKARNGGDATASELQQSLMRWHPSLLGLHCIIHAELAGEDCEHLGARPVSGLMVVIDDHDKQEGANLWGDELGERPLIEQLAQHMGLTRKLPLATAAYTVLITALKLEG